MKFDDLFTKITNDRLLISGFDLSSGECDIQRRMYRAFYEAGLAQANNEIRTRLEKVLFEAE